MRRFIVCAEPRGQGRPRAGNGTIYKAKEDKAWEKTILHAYQMQCPAALPFAGAVKVCIEAVLAIPASKPRKVQDDMMAGKIPAQKKPDVDNVAKAVLDALNHAAWHDDKQVVQLTVNKRYGHPARMIVVIEEVENENQ